MQGKMLPENIVYIDLPGENAKGVMTGCANRIILKKHRDVVVEINIKKGDTYLARSTQSDFYCDRDKQLIQYKKKQHVIFKDGEKLHLWISRDFKGCLVVESLSGGVIGQFKVNAIDVNNYGNAPRDKPAPFMISLSGSPKKEAGSTVPPHGTPMLKLNSLNPYNSNPVKVHAADTKPVVDSHQVVQVVDLNVKTAPPELWEHFKKGGDGTGLYNYDPSKVATRNWLYGQLAGTTAYVADNWEWLRHAVDTKTSKGTQLVKAHFHYVRGKLRIYFSGYSKSNPVFGPGGFGIKNENVLKIFYGAGDVKSTFSSAWKAARSTVKGNALITFIFSSATAVAEWQADAKKDGYDLFANIFVSLLKAILVAYITSFVVAIIGALWCIIAGSSMTILAIGAITIVLTLVFSYMADASDKIAGKALVNDGNSDGIAAYLAPLLREAEKKISSNWNYLKNKFGSEYEKFSLEGVF
ncbi:hypothetical protein [Chromobacterium violaceum]|uniref:hypothetical protein n=1 Tax=Chromobacterium violaceum TaxID=536 RepID=UPI000A4FF0B0|nr:hypothetical protein [Chromobacterium violaceum]